MTTVKQIEIYIQKNPGSTYRELGEKVGVSRQRAHQIVKRLGLERGQREEVVDPKTRCPDCGNVKVTRSKRCRQCHLKRIKDWSQTKLSFVCANCGITFTRTRSVVSASPIYKIIA